MSQLDNLSKLMKTLTDETLRKSDFLAAFKEVLTFVKKMQRDQAIALGNIEKRLAKHLGDMETKMNTDQDALVGELQGQIQTAVENNQAVSRRLMNSIERQIMSFEMMKDEERADMLQDLSTLIPEQTPEETPEETRDKLESLQGDERLKVSAIDGLEELVKRLEKKAKTPERLGGGTNAIGVANAMKTAIKTETPSGDINGSNTAYTTAQPINAILSFVINGQSIQPAEYSYSGNSITMTSALDASLSGTNFTIVYA